MWLVTLVLASISSPAARAHAQAAGPFPEVPIRSVPRRSHWGAHGALLAGAGLVGASFVFQRQADRKYSEYLIATDPERIGSLFDETVRLDRLSSGSLIAGELLMAAGLYLRFLRPQAEPLSLELTTDRCAVSWRF